jgi:hypothetical protein
VFLHSLADIGDPACPAFGPRNSKTDREFFPNQQPALARVALGTSPVYLSLGALSNLRTPALHEFISTPDCDVKLIRDTLLQVAYVGTHGLRILPINQARIASVSTRSQAGHRRSDHGQHQRECAATPADAGSQYGFFNLNQNGQSTYHSPPATRNRRFSCDLELQGSYTFAKSVDNASFPELHTSGIVGNSLLRATAASMICDRTHRFVGYFQWDLPKIGFTHDSRAARLLLSNWNASGGL